MSKMIVIQGTLGFPSLFSTDRFDKYSATILFPQGGAEHDKVQVAIMEVMKDLGDSKPTAICMKDGDSAAYAGYAGNMSISASRTTPFKPNQLINRSKQPVTTEGVFYPGCRVNMAISIWAQNNNWGKKINAELLAIQFVGDGDRLAAGAVADISDDTFAELPPLEDAGLTEEDFI